jgi:UDP-glucose 4-epimerase
MKVLVTGGAGFIGSNLVRKLLDSGYQVKIIDDFSTGNPTYLTGLKVEIHEGSILDQTAVRKAVSGVDAVVHLAAQTGVPSSIADPWRDCEINVLGTLRLLEQSREFGVKRFVFASSNAPLGRQPPPANEDKAPLPVSPYGASKLAGEAYCLAYHGSWGLGTVVLRFANLYGPYSAHKSSVVAKFFKDIIKTGGIQVDGDGNQTRDFIYVGDLCHAVLLALDSNVQGEVFQIATGVETSINELVDLVKITTRLKLDVVHGKRRRGDIDKNYSDITKVHRILGWEPNVSLEEGLKITWEWFRRQKYF